jgi:N-acetylglucosaminyl-diphospho-decaprenol L-rhamnosyltransferase
VAIVSWNTSDLLRACLRSFERDVTAGLVEVWVVDNASTDGSAEMARTEFPWAIVVASSENLGFGPAVNLVAERTRSSWIAIANADIEVAAGSVSKLLEVGTRDPEAGIVAPRLVLPDGATQHSVYAFPTLPYTLLFNSGIWRVSPRLADQMALEGHWNPDRARAVDWALGAFLLMRRPAWDAIGGFDPSQWMYAEDLDLGWRAAQAGWKTLFESTAVVRHHGAAATSQLWGDARDERWQRSTYAWMLRRRGLVVTRSFGLMNTAGAAVRTGLLTIPAVVLGRPWRAKWATMRRWLHLHLGNLRAPRSELEGHR